MSRPLRLAASLAMLLAVVPSVAALDRPKPYSPLPATVGKPLKPSAELLETVARLRAAAAAGDVEAVFALVADEVTFVTTGITAAAPRNVEKVAMPQEIDAALEKIGLAFTEGEPEPRQGLKFDYRASRAATALRMIAEEAATADWASDPLVPGGWCTRPGAKWDAAAAEKAGLDDRSLFLLAAAEARAEPKPEAKVLAKLAPAKLYRTSGQKETDWTPVDLPDGRRAWLPPGAAKSAQPWGFCFLPTAEGGWLLATVISALN
ncbi:MAG: hypothetical protein LWW93_11630 [Hyphomicrobiales bacterium]|nr:hypothetical protein [Hyphomicrobiales bacterium]